jgi:chromosome partitioning protein
VVRFEKPSEAAQISKMNPELKMLKSKTYESTIRLMRYALWNNKGGVGKTFLSFILSTELAHRKKKPVVVVDMCPQANLSEIVLGGNGTGSARLEQLITERKTVGGYFDTRIGSPHTITGRETDYLIRAKTHNPNLPEDLWLIAGDPSLEIQAQVINQISGQTLPVEAWRNVHNWLKEMIMQCSKKLGEDSVSVLIDCNPSFSAYTELSMVAAERVIIPCSSDGSSARAIDNVGTLLYGVSSGGYGAATFSSKAEQNKISLPQIHSVLLNRSTQYSNKASKAFEAMFDEIKNRSNKLKQAAPNRFVDGQAHFLDIPDSHSVAIVCSHLGMPLYSVKPGKYDVFSTSPQVNPEPLERYQAAVEQLIGTL